MSLLAQRPMQSRYLVAGITAHKHSPVISADDFRRVAHQGEVSLSQFGGNAVQPRDFRGQRFPSIKRQHGRNQRSSLTKVKRRVRP